MRFFSFLILFLFLVSCERADSQQKFEIMTHDESQKRAKALLSLEGSEDVSDMLILPGMSKEANSQVSAKLVPPSSEQEYDFFATEEVEWILTIQSIDRTPMSRQTVLDVFDDIRTELYFNPSMYCIAEDHKYWGYISQDECKAEQLSKIAL